MFPVNLLKKNNQGYNSTNSIRFDGTTNYLSFTPGFGGINYKQTQSVWFKLSKQKTHNGVFLSSWKTTSTVRYYWLWQISGNKLLVYHNNGLTTALNILTSTDELFSDINAWYHLVAVLDTHQASASNRLKIYLNGELITRWSTDNRSSIVRYSENRPFAHPGIPHSIGRAYPEIDTTQLFEGLMSDYHFIDGEVLNPSQFGQYFYFGKKRLWVPKHFTKNHGVNGFHLKFNIINSEQQLGLDYKLDPSVVTYTDERNFIQGTPNVEPTDFFGFAYLSDAQYKFGTASLYISNNQYQDIKTAKCATIPISGVFDIGNNKFEMDSDWTIEAWVFPTAPPPATGRSFGNSNGLGKTMSTLLCFHESTGVELSKDLRNQSITSGNQWGIYVGLNEPGASPYLLNASRGSRNKLFNFNSTGEIVVRSSTPADSAQRQGLNVFGLFHGYYSPYIVENFQTSSPQSGTVFFAPRLETKYFTNQAEANAYFSSVGISPVPQYPTGNYFLTSTSTLALNAWNHIAITHYRKDPGNANYQRYDYYLNGTHVGRDVSQAFSKFDKNNPLETGYCNFLTIGGMPVWDSGRLSYVNPFYGYIDDLKISTGIYYGSGGFTVPTSRLKTDVNTILYAPFNGSNWGLRTSYFNSGAQANNLNVAGFTSGDSFKDSPAFITEEGENKANYMSLNGLAPTNTPLNAGLALSNKDAQSAISSFGVNAGKWYWEVTATRNGDCYAGVFSEGNKDYARQIVYRAQCYAFRLNLDIYPPTLEYSQTADNFSAYWTQVPISRTYQSRSGDYYYLFLESTPGSLAEINFGQKPFELWTNIYDRENLTGYSGYFNTTGYWRTFNTIHLKNLAVNPTEHLQIKEFDSQNILSSGEVTSIDFGTGDNPSLFMLVKGKEYSEGTAGDTYYNPIIVPNRNLLGSGNNLYLQINSTNEARDLGVPADLSYMGKRWYNIDTFNGRLVENDFLSGIRRLSDFGQAVSINNDGTSIVIGAPNISASNINRPYNAAKSTFASGAAIIFTGLAGNIALRNTQLTGLRSFRTGQYPYFYNFIFDSTNDWVWPTKEPRYGMWAGYDDGSTQGFYQTGYTGLQGARLTGATTSNAFGYSVSVDSNSKTIIVGAPKTSYIKQTGDFPTFFLHDSWIPTGFGKDYNLVALAKNNINNKLLFSDRYGYLYFNPTPTNPSIVQLSDTRRNYNNICISDDGINQYALAQNNIWRSLDGGFNWSMANPGPYDYLSISSGSRSVYGFVNDTLDVYINGKVCFDGANPIRRAFGRISYNSGLNFTTLIQPVIFNLKKVITSKAGHTIALFRDNSFGTPQTTDFSFGMAFTVYDETGKFLHGDGLSTLNTQDRSRWNSPASAAISHTGRYQVIVNRHGYIWRSTNGGKIWSSSYPIKKLPTGCTDVAMNFDGSLITVISETGQICRSTDQGLTFVTGGTPTNTKPYKNIKMSDDGRYQLITTHGNYLYVSNDSGINWTAKVTDVPRVWSDLDISSDGNIQVAVSSGVNGELFLSEDAGNNWNKIQTNAEINYSKVAQSNNGQFKVVVASNGKIFNSSNFGRTWTSTLLFFNFSSVAMNGLGNYQVACIKGGNFYESTNYGATWAVKTTAGSRNWSSISISKDQKYQTAVVEGGQIYISSNSGGTWVAKESNRLWKSIAVSSDGKYQTAVGYNTRIYTSSDFGVTWVARSTDIHGIGTRNWSSVTINDDGRYQIVVDSNGYIFKSNDFGVTWFNDLFDYGSNKWSSCSISRNGRFQLVANTGTIDTSVFFSNNFGSSWSSLEFPLAPTYNWNDVSISNDGRYIIGLDNFGYIYNSKLELLNNSINTMTHAGLVYVFTGEGLDYRFANFITGRSNLHGQEHFGHKVKINQDGNLLAIGAPYEGDFTNGAVYIYTGNRGSWKLCERITGSSGSYFGWDIDVNVPSIASGRHAIAISAPMYSQDYEYPYDISEKRIGQVHIITGSGSNFKLKNIIDNPAYPSDSGCFGYSIGMNASGNLLVIGSPSGHFDPNNVYTVVSGIYRVGSNNSYYNQNDNLIGQPFFTGSNLTTIYNKNIVRYGIPKNLNEATISGVINISSAPSTPSLLPYVGGDMIDIGNDTSINFDYTNRGWHATTKWALFGNFPSWNYNFGTGLQNIYANISNGQFYKIPIRIKNNSPEAVTNFRITGVDGLKFKLTYATTDNGTNLAGLSARFCSLLYSGQFKDSTPQLLGSVLIPKGGGSSFNLGMGVIDTGPISDLSVPFSNFIRNANINIPATGSTSSNYTTGTFFITFNSVPADGGASANEYGNIIWLGGNFNINGTLSARLNTDNYSKFRMNAPFFVQTINTDFFPDPNVSPAKTSYYDNLYNLDKRQNEKTLKNSYIVQTNFPGRNVFISTTGWSGNRQLDALHGLTIGSQAIVDFGAAGVQYGTAPASNTYTVLGTGSDYDLTFNCGGNKDLLSSGYCRILIPNKNIDGTGKAYIYFSPINRTWSSQVTGMTGDYNIEARTNPNIYNNIDFGFGSIRRPYTSLFGHSVSMSDSGHVIFVGAPKELFPQSFRPPYNSLADVGYAYVYTGQTADNAASKFFQTSGTFIRNSKISASNRNQYNNFGSHISTNRRGDFSIIGSSFENNSVAVTKAGNENILNYSGAAYVFNLGRPRTQDFFNPPSGTVKFTAYNFGSNDNKLSYPFLDSRGKMEMLIYTGNSRDSRDIQIINHNLSKTPAFVITKCMTRKSDWWVWHQDMPYNHSNILLNRNLPTNNSGAYLLKYLVNYGANDQGFYSLSNVSGILETTNAERITGMTFIRSPLVSYDTPASSPTISIDASQSVTGIIRGGLFLGSGLYSTRTNPYGNGWAVTGFNIVGTGESDIENAINQGKYWQFSVGLTGNSIGFFDKIPVSGITGIRITGISGLEVRINNAGTPATPNVNFINYGPRFWSLQFAHDSEFLTKRTIGNYYSPTNTANLVLPLGEIWSRNLRADPISLGHMYNSSGYFRLVGLGVPSTQGQTTGSGILFKSAPAGQLDWGLGGEILRAPTGTNIITTSGSASIIPDSNNREFIGGWNGTTGSSGPYREFKQTYFSVQGTGNILNERYVSFLFGEVEGLSKFGTYLGNGSAAGPFINTNFSPKLIIIKNINISPGSVTNPSNLEKTHWLLIDNYNNKTNPAYSYYILNKEDTVINTNENNIEFLSNGFRIKSADSANCLININGGRYIYAAFAESPFKYNNAYTGV